MNSAEFWGEGNPAPPKSLLPVQAYSSELRTQMRGQGAVPCLGVTLEEARTLQTPLKHSSPRSPSRLFSRSRHSTCVLSCYLGALSTCTWFLPWSQASKVLFHWFYTKTRNQKRRPYSRLWAQVLGKRVESCLYQSSHHLQL